VEEWFQEERLKKSDKRGTLEMCCMSEVTDCVGDARTFVPVDYCNWKIARVLMVVE